MRYHTHIVTSLAIGAGIAAQTSLSFTLSYAAGITIGSLLPDIDEPNSYVGRRSLGMSSKVKQAFGHRGMTHSLVVWIVLAFVLMFQESHTLFSYGLIIGYLLHIIEDFFSMQGVPLFWPFKMRRYKFPIAYRTAGFVETIIFYGAFAFFVYICVQNNLLNELTKSTMQFFEDIVRLL